MGGRAHLLFRPWATARSARAECALQTVARELFARALRSARALAPIRAAFARELAGARRRRFARGRISPADHERGDLAGAPASDARARLAQ